MSHLISLKQPSFEKDGLEIQTFPYLLEDAFQQTQDAVFSDFTPARNASNRNARGLRLGVLVNQQLHWTDKNTYQISAAFNSEEAGKVREMDLIPEAFLRTPQIERLIKEAFILNFGDIAESNQQAYLVQLNAIRYQPTVSTTAYPPPDHPHQDGCDNTVVVLRKSPSILGGMSRVYTLDEDPLYEVNLAPGQALFVEDDRYKHQVLPMMLDTGKMSASENNCRDILIIQIDPVRC